MFLILISGMEVSVLEAQVDTRNTNFAYLLDQLRRDISRGSPRALRELGSLFDHPEVGERAKNIVREHSLFKESEVNFQFTNRKEFLSFYYDHSKEIKYSPLLRAFYLTPIEEQETKYEIKQNKKTVDRDPAVQLRLYIRKFEVLVELGNDEEVVEMVNSIGKLKSQEGFQFFTDVLLRNRLFLSPLKNPAAICREICEKLIDYPKEETLKTYLQLIDDQVITPQFAAPLLAKLTNIWVVQDQQYREIGNRYQYWLDSLGTIDAMRHFGYDLVFNFNRKFFQFPVDYYGKVLSESDDFPWIRHNALIDIVNTGHPRSLFYIAGLGYRFRGQPHLKREFTEVLNLLNQKSNIQLRLPDRNAVLGKHDYWEDEVALLNFIKYWGGHYRDFEWDELRGNFVNREEAMELTENYERLFRRLNSTNDSVAMQAYQLLAEGEAVEVRALAKKYKELLRNYNRSLPSLKHQFLEQLVLLTQFCRRNNIHYKPPARLLVMMNQLGRATSPKDRFNIENQIINRLSIDEVTSLEYWGCLNESSEEISFSVGRILDRFYTINWEKITEKEPNLRLYLKKAKLFSEIGVVGICNDYLKKFEYLSPQQKKTLENLLEVEGDKDILEQANLLLGRHRDIKDFSIYSFLENPEYWEKDEIKKLPALKSSELLDFFNGLVVRMDTDAEANFWQYLEIHKPMEFVPYLFQILEIGQSEKQIVKVLEKTFDHKMRNGAADWKALKEERKKSFEEWPQMFFEQKVAEIQKNEVLNIKEINSILLSPFYHPTLKTVCLHNLHKVKPSKNVRRLKPKVPLSIKEDLRYFDDFVFSYRELDDIPKLFNLKEDLNLLISWIYQKSKQFNVDDRGSFYNNLFRTNWFSDFVNNSKIDKEIAAYIKNTLEIYLARNEYMSEFEEMASTRNIAFIENIGKSLTQKIVSSSELDLDEGSKFKVQEAFISRISYDEIADVVPHFNQLGVLKDYNFLNKDFGLPVFDLENYYTQQSLISNHYKLEEEEFYRYYLTDFGVDYLTQEGSLDFEKIYEILQYEIVSPFVGEGGNKRDYYTFGIIKLLELNFETNLGFHEKLNENQTFYTYTASKRAHAWMDYLEQNNIIQAGENHTPSFNVTVRE